jgi:alcohol dehydrogenase class IV
MQHVIRSLDPVFRHTSVVVARGAGKSMADLVPAGWRARKFVVLTDNEAAAQYAVYHCRRLGGIPFVLAMKTDQASMGNVQAAHAAAARLGAEGVIGMGTRSVLQIAQATAMMLTNPGTIEKYVGEGAALKPAHPSAPCVLVPTQPCGSEIALRPCLVAQAKVALGVSPHQDSYLGVAVDPELFSKLPREVASVAAIGTLVQSAELYCSRHATAPHQALALETLIQASTHLGPFVREPSNVAAAMAMAEASVKASALSCIHPAGIARAVSLAASSRYVLDQDALNAWIAPVAFDAAEEMLDEAADSDPRAAHQLERWLTVRDTLTSACGDTAPVKSAGEALRRLTAGLPMPSVDHLDLTPADLSNIGAGALIEPDMAGLGVYVTKDAVMEIIEQVL